eukprot:c11227_g1_i1.p1 GENE.c11227_g1_i1~~c11227_g1_i1.p1  ORF type:complete len:330 (+),score=74.08 c11227_g1_i1:193-1182(+)
MNKMLVGERLIALSFFQVILLILGFFFLLTFVAHRFHQQDPQNSSNLCTYWSCTKSVVLKNGKWPNPRPELSESNHAEWLAIHRQQVSSTRNIITEAIVFAGDDSIEMFLRHPFGSEKSGVLIPENDKIWKSTFYSNTISLNFGIGGDRVQDLAWRLENGILSIDDFDPVVICILIGVNDLKAGESSEVVVEEILHLLDLITQKKPETAILFIGILPCGERISFPRGATGSETGKVLFNWDANQNTMYNRINTVNERLLEAVNRQGELVSFVDCSSFFLEKTINGEKMISETLMSNQFDLTPAGYGRLSSCIRYPLQMAYYSAMSTRFI